MEFPLAGARPACNSPTPGGADRGRDAIVGPYRSQQRCGASTRAPWLLAAAAAHGARRSRRRRGRRGTQLRGAAEGAPESTEGFLQLLQWLGGSGALGLESVRAGDSSLADAGSGVFAARDLASGERFLAVPHSACLAVEDGPLGLGAELAAALLRERSRGAASPLALYVASLPSARDLASHPLLWPAEVHPRTLLGSSPQALRMVRHMQMRAAEEAEELVRAGAARTLSEARWALAIVESRAVTLGDGSAGAPERLALCPLVDLLNHDVPPAGEPSSCLFMDAPQHGMVVLSTDRPVRRSEELCLVYETCSTAQIFARYGFVQQLPAGETCLLEVPLGDPQLPGGPEARALRLDFVRRAGWRRSAWKDLLLRLPDNARAEGALLSVARLAVLPDADALRRLGRGVLNGGGLEPELEARARAQAGLWLEEAQARVDAAAARLEGAPGAPAGGPEIRRAALGLLRIERGVLERSAEILAAALQ